MSNAYLLDYERERKRAYAELNRLTAQLTMAQRARWNRIVESYEWFDGETEIELSHLRSFIKNGKK